MANVTTSTAGTESVSTSVGDNVLVSANYNKLTNKPTIEGKELKGNMEFTDFAEFMDADDVEEIVTES